MLQPDSSTNTKGESISVTSPDVSLDLAVWNETPAEETRDGTVATNPSESDADACPTPLGWRQVVHAIQTDAITWELKRNGYVLRGKTFGEGPPLYFLNGLGGTCDLFALTVWLLREDFRCVLFDSADGFGYSGTGRRPSVEHLAEDLFAIAEMQDDQRFSLYATSFGTLVALEAMLQCPDHIDRAVIQGGFACRNLSFVERMLASMGCLLPGSLHRIPFQKRIQLWNHRCWFPPFDHTRWQFFADNTGSVPIATQARRASVLIDCDLRSRLKKIKQPVLLIRSEGEGLVSEKCHRELESGLVNKQTEYMNSTGHLPYLTHPHRLAKLIRPFLQQNSE